MAVGDAKIRYPHPHILGVAAERGAKASSFSLCNDH